MTGFSYPPPPTTAPAGPDRALRWSLVLLVAANLVPVVGVLLDRLSLGDVFVLYWAENVVVGAFALVRIVTARGPADPKATFWVGSKANTRPVASVDPAVFNPLLGLFFCFHFGLFTLVHGIFTFTLVSMVDGLGSLSFVAILGALAALVGSHLYSLVVHWFRRGERQRTSATQAMGAPYPRVVVLHVSVLGSFFLLMAAGDGSLVEASGDDTTRVLLPVLLLTALKLAVDWKFHRRAHREPAPQS